MRRSLASLRLVCVCAALLCACPQRVEPEPWQPPRPDQPVRDQGIQDQGIQDQRDQDQRDQDHGGQDLSRADEGDAALGPELHEPADAAPDLAPEPVPAELLGHCQEVDRFGPVFPDVIARWRARDDADPWPAGRVVFVGSSSMRRWDDLARAYAGYLPIQRGFGGAQLGEVARSAWDLILRHRPRGVVVFAGTNDVAAGVSPPIVVARLRCLRERMAVGLGLRVPLIFIGITPTPSRWAQWPQARAVNEAVAALAASDPGLIYADVPAAFLAQGQPPPSRLFVSDQLHLSPEGYALWDAALRPIVEAALAPSAPAPPGAALARGARWLIDLGPDEPQDGERAPQRDRLGQRWNAWHSASGGDQVLPGERLTGLVTATGQGTSVELLITGGFGLNGKRHGGLTQPDPARLGELALPEATQDFFYAEDEDLPGGLALRGLDPQASYTLRVFAWREAPERRVSAYTVHGAQGRVWRASLQTSGPGAQPALVELTGLRPDAWGQLFLDVARQEGSFAYVSLLELVVE